MRLNTLPHSLYMLLLLMSSMLPIIILHCGMVYIGPLRSVTDFRRGSPNEGKINFFWTPPPTLDLTNVEPDIVYCVEVYDITCGKTEYLSGPYDCDLLNPVYDADLDADKIYLVKVIARSNVVGAMNGTTLITTGIIGQC